jgi:hypothetical protein
MPRGPIARLLALTLVVGALFAALAPAAARQETEPKILRV